MLTLNRIKRVPICLRQRKRSSQIVFFYHNNMVATVNARRAKELSPTRSKLALQISRGLDVCSCAHSMQLAPLPRRIVQTIACINQIAHNPRIILIYVFAEPHLTLETLNFGATNANWPAGIKLKPIHSRNLLLSLVQS